MKVDLETHLLLGRKIKICIRIAIRITTIWFTPEYEVIRKESFS